MSNYQEMKERARQLAIDWQMEASEISLSREGCIIADDYFRRLSRRYGLVREFRENAII